MKRLGLSPLGVDQDDAALAVYRQAVGDAIKGNIQTLTPESVGVSPELIWASPPCQPWSEGRRNQGLLWGFDLDDGKLLLEPVRWVDALKPRWLVVENVDGLPAEMLRPLAEELSKRFAAVSVLRLNAKEWLPQNRGHVFVIGGPTQVPVPAARGKKTHFADISEEEFIEPVKANHLKYAMRRRFGVPVVTPDGILPTVATRPFSQRWTAFVMPEAGRLRFPTFREAARAQGFPDSHPLHELHRKHPQVAWRLLGNAVPVALAEAVLQAVYNEGERGKERKTV
jgi:site-specific DNA-cytosine methylase